MLLRELEDPEHAALVDAEVLLRDLAAPERDGAAPARRDGDVLLALRLPGHGRRGDAGAGVELPQLLAGLRVERLEVALGRAREDEAAVRREHAAPEHA